MWRHLASQAAGHNAPTIAQDHGVGLRPQINQFAKGGSLGFQIAP